MHNEVWGCAEILPKNRFFRPLQGGFNLNNTNIALCTLFTFSNFKISVFSTGVSGSQLFLQTLTDVEDIEMNLENSNFKLLVR